MDKKKADHQYQLSSPTRCNIALIAHLHPVAADLFFVLLWEVAR